MNKKTILFDLDGVLNTYSGNFDTTFIPPVNGEAKKLIKELSKNYKIVIFTARNLLLSSKWIMENGLADYVDNVTNIKEPAYLIIDDRCINFNGNYKELKDNIEKFEVWYKKN